MQKQELEVQVGDTLHIGDYTITIVDVDGDEAAFRIDASTNLPKSTSKTASSR